MTSKWLRGLIFGLAIAAAGAGSQGQAFADTLFGAMEKAYTTNPTLQGRRAGQRAIDEQVPQALSGWRPTVTMQSSLTRNYSEYANGQRITKPNLGNEGNGDIQIILQQPLFRGFKTVEGTKAAEARVEGGRQDLLSTEQNVLFAAVQAYMEVYAGRQLVVLQKQNVAAMNGQLKAANERFAVGEITRTDVAQARASLADAQSQLTSAQATLTEDVASYLQIIGNEPGKLAAPKIAKLPKTLNAALAKAGETNPEILAKAFVEVALQHDIEVARGDLLPSANLQANAFVQSDFEKWVGRNNDFNIGGQLGTTRGASVSAVVNVPIYEAGAVYSSIRRAKQLASQQRISVIEVGRAVRQAVAATWSSYVALGEIIAQTKVQVSAAALALDGVQQEYQAGTRTTQDVLDQQTKLVAAKVRLVTAEKNRVIAAYRLLSAVGILTARDLGLNVTIYDPAENYNRVRNKWIGTGVETIE